MENIIFERQKLHKDICEQLKNCSQKSYLLTKPIQGNGTITTILANYRKFNTAQLGSSFEFSPITIINEEKFARKVILKTGKTKAPLLVFIAGAGLSVDMQAFCEYIVPLCQAYPDWHIAVLENTTSGEWLARNIKKYRPIVSGYEAGWDLYLILKELRKIPLLKNKITKLHLIGLSLGGSDAAFCAYADSITKSSLIDGSIMAWSSPLDRYQILNHLRHISGPFRPCIQFLFWDVFRKSRQVFRQYTEKSPFWALQRTVSNRMFLEEFYLKAAAQYFNQHDHHFEKLGKRSKILMRKPKNFHVSNLEKLFFLENYLPYIKQPFLWINSSNDPIVPAHINRKLLSSVKLPSNMTHIEYAYGGHLGFSTAYTREWLVNVISSYISFFE